MDGCAPHLRKGLFPRATDQCFRCPTVLCWNSVATWSASSRRSKRHLDKWHSNNRWSCRTQTALASWRADLSLVKAYRLIRNHCEVAGAKEYFDFVWHGKKCSRYLVLVQASLVIHLKRVPAPFRTGLDFFRVTNTWPLFCLSGMNVIKSSLFGRHLL